MAAQTYDSNAVVLTVGNLIIEGFSDGDKITVERDGELWVKKVGIGGAVTRSRNNQSVGGSITIRLMYGRAGNAVLEAFKTLDLVLGHNPVDISIVDTNGGSIVYGKTCWNKSDIGPAYGQEVGEFEWVFDCAQLSIIPGVLVED